MAPQWRCRALFTLVILWATGAISAVSDKSKEERRVEYEMFIDRMMDLMPPDELAEELVGVIQRRTADSDKRQKKVLTSRVDDLDDEALLERIGRLAVRWINTRLTPRSDEECSWSWGRWRCDPQCDCEYRYRFGDYAPGRSCRLRTAKERDLGTCNPEAGNDVSLLEKFASFMGKVARHTWRFTSEHVIPQTDQECRFSISRSLEEKRAVCLPRKSCTFYYKFGDLHPGRSCRMHHHSSHLAKSGKVEDDDYYYIEDDDDVDSPVGRAKAEASATDSGKKSDNKSFWYFDDEGDEEL